MAKPNPMGATFAERRAAARGEKNFTPPRPRPQATSFAQRAGVEGAETDEKAVESAENKAVSGGERKGSTKGKG